jgi:hypothetical protein
MRIRDVDFPELLLNAQENSNLVIFAGAGVSIPAPSNYPNFEQLADEVAKGVLPKGKDEPVDRFLGRLVDKKVRVHEKVRKILSNPDSAPNPLHSDLLRLFAKASDVRLVTTNFDGHFASAAKSLFPSEALEIYSAPAMPLGNPLQGLVHLHGSIDKPAERLVLTDSDFGRAYLTQGWATRFLQELFARYVVLFVGYSHSDPVMNYLARGLPSKLVGLGRFALTAEGENDRWTYLGITPITYKLGEGDHKHSALGSTLAAWVDLARRGVLDHEQNIKNIVDRPVPLGGEDLDYIERMLGDVSTAQFFTRYAKTVDWLQWIESKQPFTRLFENSPDLPPVERMLAWWFAHEFACKHPAEALAVVRRKGQLLGRVLCIALGQSFHANRPSPEILGKWIPLLIKSRTSESHDDFLHYILHASSYPEDAATAVVLFEYLTKPSVVLKQDLWSIVKGDPEENVDFELATENQDIWLRGVWNTFFQPNLEIFADRLTWVVVSHLEEAYSLLEACGKTRENWDAISLSRESIEFSQTNPREGLGVLVDAARDILQWNIAHHPARADALIDIWLSSRCNVLKRLAIFGAARNSHWNADKKASWLLENNLLYSRGVQREIFLVLESAYPTASDPLKVAVLEQVVKGRPGDVDKDWKEREICSLLYRLTKAAPDCPHARARLEEMIGQHPEFREKARTDEGISPWEGGEFRSPLNVTELLSKSPEEWLEYLISYDPQNLQEPSREGLLNKVEQAARQDFDWGLKLAVALSSKGEWSSDLWRRVIAQWRSQDLDEEQWRQVLGFLIDNEKMLPAVVYDACYLLENGIKKVPNGIPKSVVIRALEVAEKLWKVCAAIERPRHEEIEHPFASHREVEDWLSVAINNPAGVLMEFWLRALLKERHEVTDLRNDIPQPYKRAFASVLSGDSYSAELARVLLASHLHVLFSLEEEWTIENVLPLFQWSSDQQRAVQAWHGYLWWGRWTEALLPHLLPRFEEAFPVLHSKFGKHRNKFCEFLAGIACFSTINPTKHPWLNRFLSTVTVEERVMWASSVQKMLKEMKEPAIQIAWDSWIRQYWQDRIDGIPVALDAKETAAMAHWSIRLKGPFSEVVSKICEGPKPEMKEHASGYLYYELSESDLPTRHPTSVTKLVLYLLQNGVASYWDFDSIDKLIRKIPASSANKNELLEICESLAGLGHPGAGALRNLIDGAKN